MGNSKKKRKKQNPRLRLLNDQLSDRKLRLRKLNDAIATAEAPRTRTDHRNLEALRRRREWDCFSRSTSWSARSRARGGLGVRRCESAPWSKGGYPAWASAPSG